MQIRLTRKLSGFIDGVDLSAHQVGDVFEVTRQEGELLIAEGWAVHSVVRPRRMKSRMAGRLKPGPGDRDRRRVLTMSPLNDLRKSTEPQSFGGQERRRAEDHFREELRDSRATTISAITD